MARPRKPIDTELVRKLAAIACTQEEIAGVVGVSVDTLQRRCAGVMDHGRLEAHVSIRRKQFELAMNGDKTMLIWLGKQYLGQSDKSEIATRDMTIEDILNACEDQDRATEERAGPSLGEHAHVHGAGLLPAGGTRAEAARR